MSVPDLKLEPLLLSHGATIGVENDVWFLKMRSLVIDGNHIFQDRSIKNSYTTIDQFYDDKKFSHARSKSRKYCTFIRKRTCCEDGTTRTVLQECRDINDHCHVYSEVNYDSSQLSHLVEFLQFRFKREEYEILKDDLFDKIYVDQLQDPGLSHYAVLSVRIPLDYLNSAEIEGKMNAVNFQVDYPSLAYTKFMYVIQCEQPILYFQYFQSSDMMQLQIESYLNNLSREEMKGKQVQMYGCIMSFILDHCFKSHHNNASKEWRIETVQAIVEDFRQGETVMMSTNDDGFYINELVCTQ